MPDVVISNSSCLITLDRIGQLGCLGTLYTEIRVPLAVVREVGGVLPPRGNNLVSLLGQAVSPLYSRTQDRRATECRSLYRSHLGHRVAGATVIASCQS